MTDAALDTGLHSGPAVPIRDRDRKAPAWSAAVVLSLLIHGAIIASALILRGSDRSEEEGGRAEVADGLDVILTTERGTAAPVGVVVVQASASQVVDTEPAVLEPLLTVTAEAFAISTATATPTAIEAAKVNPSGQVIAVNVVPTSW